MAILGNNNIEASDAGWGGDIDLSLFAFSGSTGTYTGDISVYLHSVAGGTDNKMAVGIYNADTGAKVAQSAEATGLATGWNTASISGSFTLTNGVNYWLVAHAPTGNSGRLNIGGGATNQHSWKGAGYSSTLPASITPDGSADDLGSIYLEYTAVGSAIKSVIGLAKASIKSVDSLAIASVKSLNGLQ